MTDKEIKLEDSFRDLKDVHQKQLLLKFLVNFSAKKVQEIEKMNQDLEAQVKKKTEELIKSERLAAIGKFSSNLAHDLRNPLSVIKITTQMLQGKSDLSDQDKKKLERIIDSIDSISYQINDVLNFVKRKPPKLETVSMQNVLDRALKNLQIPEEISLEKPNADISLLCDVEQLRVVFTNLLSNAVEAIKQSGKITVRCKETNDKTIIEFEDSGPGIPEDKMSEIFEPLVTTKDTGTGLGLASTISILEAHKGKISAKNNPTTFTIELSK